MCYSKNVWFARVPTEANIADIPSRFAQHALLTPACDASAKAMDGLTKFLQRIKSTGGESKSKGEAATRSSPIQKEAFASEFKEFNCTCKDLTVKLLEQNRTVLSCRAK